MELYYRIDERERIIEVGDGWDSSAMDHASDECISKYVIGVNLFSYISGDPAKMWLRSIIEKVRTTEKTDIRSYRCDTPWSRREFLQTVALDGHGNILVHHELVSETQMPVTVRIQETGLEPQASLRCSVCNRIKRDSEWVDPFEIGKDINLKVIHTVCSSCRTGAEKPGLTENGSAPKGK